MAKKAHLTESLPKLAVDPELRRRVEGVADAAEVGMADVQRDCLEAGLPALELQFGLVDLDDVVEDVPAVIKKEDRSAGCFGGPPAAG